jgi:hypothetical protein
MERTNVRTKGYQDYGLTQSQVDKTLKYCMRNTAESNKILFDCAFDSNSTIGSDLFYSLSQDVSFERLDAIKAIPYSKGDFYGYRRLCVYLVNQCIQEK